MQWFKFNNINSNNVIQIQFLMQLLVKSFHSLIKNMYILAVFTSNDFHSSHDSVMNKWNTNYFVTKTFMKFGSIMKVLLVFWKCD